MTLKELLRTELKPCPFCGRGAIGYYSKRGNAISKTFRYFCPNCKADLRIEAEGEDK